MKSLLFILFMVCCLPVTANGDGNVQYWLNKLDRSLDTRINMRMRRRIA